MNGQPQSATATVIAFPKGGVAGITRRGGQATMANDNRTLPPIVCCDGWYHDAAMADETPRKDA